MPISVLEETIAMIETMTKCNFIMVPIIAIEIQLKKRLTHQFLIEERVLKFKNSEVKSPKSFEEK